MRAVVVLLIVFYQRYLSPYKGFRCAHAVYHAGPSCSSAVSGIVERAGLLRGLPLIRRRFAECRLAARALRLESEEEKRRRRRERWTPDCDCGDACVPLDALQCADCSALDCSGLDCGGVDCVPLDCSISLLRPRSRGGAQSAQGS
jgi:putative component of membrane protein insertase Oxa1/YidC/SpoIIIJ protein YidD